MVITKILLLIGLPLILIECANIETLRNEYTPYDGIDGGYSFRYQTSDGQERKEEGQFVRTETDQKILHVIGYYKYFDPNGKYHTISYESDANGYRQTERISMGPSNNRIHSNAIKSLIG